MTSLAELQAIPMRKVGDTLVDHPLSQRYDCAGIDMVRAAAYDAQTKELEAARSRIAELERDTSYRELRIEKLSEQLLAQGLSQEDREALERDAARYRWLRMGGYPMCAVDDEAIDAAILRRLGGQTT
jgi:hypothetical protein